VPPYKFGTLKPGDRLSIKLFRERELFSSAQIDLSLTLTITKNGTIRLPYLTDVHAAGLTVVELQDELRARYEMRFKEPPRVS
jgi:protein involved in polysaccharide export with SLBB domain